MILQYIAPHTYRSDLLFLNGVSSPAVDPMGMTPTR